ncbi:MAG: Rne/Rng family ribonuclease [Planctomycetota bacterium]|jgi:ribonuclease E
MRLLLIDSADPGEQRAALVHGGLLEDLMCESDDEGPRPGDICLGRVVNLEPAIGAAFVDIGTGRNAFLHVSDWPGVGGEGEERARIDEHVAVGDNILAQVARAAIGPKGAALTGNLSLPGRYLVLLPGRPAGGVSRRISDPADRARLRGLVQDFAERIDAGIILRTAAAGATDDAIRADFDQLSGRWRRIGERGTDGAPGVIDAESGLAARALREWIDAGIERIVVDSEAARDAVQDALAGAGRAESIRIELHATPRPVFHAYGIESQVDETRERVVPLPGGGHLAFDRTEALLAIDVNSGRAREGQFLEETALATNREAAAAIARQLRLRDEGGVVVVDFIDMREEANMAAIEAEFRAALRADRARLQIGGLGAFGLFTLTRRRSGAARPATPARTAQRIWREIRDRRAQEPRLAVSVRAHPEVADEVEARLGATALGGPTVAVIPDPRIPPLEWHVAAAPNPETSGAGEQS